MTNKTYDLAILGAGAAGFAAAIHARRKKLDVVMIEAGDIGGTCVNVGCIPSKALLTAAAARYDAVTHRFPGIDTHAGPADMPALVRSADAIVRRLRDEKYVDLAREYGWEIVHGRGTFTEGPALDVDGTRIEAAHYLIATGATPWLPRVDGLAGSGYLTSTTAMALDHVPHSLVVIGGNYVGLELGQMFARLGSVVTIVETAGRIAPHEEPETSASLAGILRDEGLTLITGATVTNVTRTTEATTVRLHSDQGRRDLTASTLLVAAGRRPHTSGLNLGVVGVNVGDKGEIVVDGGLRTSNRRIWAAGDVTGHPQFVYVAGAGGALIVDNAFNSSRRTLDYRALPRVTFTSPNIAAVGLTEHEALAAGFDCESRTIPLDVLPRALVNRDTRGLVKLVADRRTGIVRGIHMLADHAGDAILAGVYAIENRMSVRQLAETWCPYLTVSEGLKLAAQSFTTDVSKLSCCGV